MAPDFFFFQFFFFFFPQPPKKYMVKSFAHRAGSLMQTHSGAAKVSPLVGSSGKAAKGFFLLLQWGGIVCIACKARSCTPCQGAGGCWQGVTCPGGCRVEGVIDGYKQWL